MYYGRLLISQSSFTSPKDVYLISGLKELEANLIASDSPVEFQGDVQQITHLTADQLKGKTLDKGENFWFKGANDKDVQGWLFKPKGWKEGETKKWPALLLIHGGPQGAWEDDWSTRWNPNGTLSFGASFEG